jgi:hypothetical protein
VVGVEKSSGSEKKVQGAPKTRQQFCLIALLALQKKVFKYDSIFLARKKSG